MAPRGQGEERGRGPKKAAKKAEAAADALAARKRAARPHMELTPPSHGVGKLRRSGPSPGSGRRPSRVKELALQGVEEALPTMADMARRGGSDGVQAFRALVQTSGLDGRISPADIRERLVRQVALIRSRSTWTADELLNELAGVWQ